MVDQESNNCHEALLIVTGYLKVVTLGLSLLDKKILFQLLFSKINCNSAFNTGSAAVLVSTLGTIFALLTGIEL